MSKLPLRSTISLDFNEINESELIQIANNGADIIAIKFDGRVNTLQKTLKQIRKVLGNIPTIIHFEKSFLTSDISLKEITKIFKELDKLSFEFLSLHLFNKSQLDLVNKFLNERGLLIEITNLDSLKFFTNNAPNFKGFILNRESICEDLNLADLIHIENTLLEKSVLSGHISIFSQRFDDDPSTGYQFSSDLMRLINSGLDSVLLYSAQNKQKSLIKRLKTLNKIKKNSSQGNKDIDTIMSYLESADESDGLNLRKIRKHLKAEKVIYISNSMPFLNLYKNESPVITISTDPILVKALKLKRHFTPVYVKDLPIESNNMLEKVSIHLFSMGLVELKEKVIVIRAESKVDEYEIRVIHINNYIK